MSVANSISSLKECYSLGVPVHRAGCPCELTSSYRISTLPAGERTRIIHEYTTMVLVHQAKDGTEKNSLRLDTLHHELEIDSLVLQKSGASNILLTKVSFDCLIVDILGEEYRDYLSFDLRIPGVNSEKESIFSYDMVENAYGSKKNLYAALRHYYVIGRGVANKNNDTHGTLPEYDPTNSKHDQYIRHTEQILVAYLALPQAAEMLCNRLRTEIRGKYTDAVSVKVYNMGVHMHSTKTCCAPCEYSLLGLMNDKTGFMQKQVSMGFMLNFKKACAIPNDRLAFTFPQQSAFRLLVTVTASRSDITHQKQPAYILKRLMMKEETPSHQILVKTNAVSMKIFSTMLGIHYDPRKLPRESTLTDKSVGISGSKATPGSPATANKVKTARSIELEQISAQLAVLKM